MQQTPQKLGRVDPAGAGGLIGGRSQKSVGCLERGCSCCDRGPLRQVSLFHCKHLTACCSCEFASPAPLHAAGGRAASVPVVSVSRNLLGRAASITLRAPPDGLDAGRDGPSHHHLNDLHVSTVHCRIEDQRLCTGSRCIEPRHLAAHSAVIRAGSPTSRVPALLLCAALP